jgi:hypothetical protein
MWSEKQDPSNVNENVSTRVTNTGVLKIPVIMILHCITLRSGSGTQGMQAKFNGPYF